VYHVRMTYRLAIFDFDGTLADSFPFFLSVFNTIADRHGFAASTSHAPASCATYGVRQMMEHVGMPAWKLPLGVEDLHGDDAGQRPRHFACSTASPDALRHLHARGVLLTVVSSNAEHNVRTVLGRSWRRWWRVRLRHVVFGKASRIRAVLKALRRGAGDALYIGDQATDAEAARKAGVAFGAVHWGYATIEALRAGCATEFVTPADLRRITSTC
jgi:phosphoglycolate phosphatase